MDFDTFQKGRDKITETKFELLDHGPDNSEETEAPSDSPPAKRQKTGAAMKMMHKMGEAIKCACKRIHGLLVHATP